MKYRDFSTQREAAIHDRQRLRRLEGERARRPGEPPSRWKPAGVRESDGKAHPAGIWPGETPRPRKPHPRWTVCDPIIGIATHDYPIRRAKRGPLSGRFLAFDEDGTDVADDDVDILIED